MNEHVVGDTQVRNPERSRESDAPEAETLRPHDSEHAVAPFRPESADVEVPVVWANNEGNEFPLSWWNAMNERLVSDSMKENENVSEHVVRLGVAMALSEVAARVANGTNPGGPNTDEPEPDQGKARAQKRLWGVVKREVKQAVGHARDLPFRDAAAAAYAPTDKGAHKRLLGDAAYVAPQDRHKVSEPHAVSDEVMQTQQVRRYTRTRYAAEDGPDSTHGGNRGMQRLDLNHVVRPNSPFQGSTVAPAPGVRGGGVREEALTPDESAQRATLVMLRLKEATRSNSVIALDELFSVMAANPTWTERRIAEHFGINHKSGRQTVRRAIDRMREVLAEEHWTIKREKAKVQRPKWWWRRRTGWSFDYAVPKRGFTHTFVSLRTGEEVTARGQTLKPIVDAMVEHGYDRAGVEAIAFWAHKEFSAAVEHPGQAPQVDFADLDEVLDALPERFVWGPASPVDV